MDKKRKLKSRNSSERDVEIVSLPCVQGGWLKESRVLPMEDMGPAGRFVPITAKDSWLHEILVGERASTSCRQTLATCLGELRNQITGHAVAAGDLPAVSAAQNIREKLQASGLNDEDSEEDFEEVDGGASSARRLKPRTTSSTMTVHNLHLKGHDVLATFHKRTFLLQYSQENLRSFVALAKTYSPEDAEEKKHEKAERRQQVPGDTQFH